ncbi:MAG: HlyD family efflux transporter periplasmic adaptor subunit [Bacteroidaceae bacterium]|nr:HlyD family efflux transporter periplasmic adaptor subunit [Bacteroidaceae bacterium]
MKTDNNNMDRAVPMEVQRRRRNIRRLKYAAAALAGIGCIVGIASLIQPSVDEDDLIFSTVDRGTIEVSVPASGQVIPFFEQAIISPISTRIVEVYCQSGDTVSEGTPLLRLDLQSAEADFKRDEDQQAIAALQRAQQEVGHETQLSDMEMKIKVAEMRIGRLAAELRNEQYLDSLGSGTTERVREARYAYDTALLELEQMRQQKAGQARSINAERRTQQLQSNIANRELQQKRRTLDDARIRSPHKATLTFIKSDIGEMVGAGEKVAIISDLSRFRLKCSISDIYSDRLSVGGAVLIRAGRDRLPGTIATVTPLSKSGSVEFTVVPDNPSHPRLRSGLQAEVHVLTSVRDDVLRLDNASYYSGPGDYNLYVRRGSELVRQAVKLGDCNFEKVEVIEGLKEGDIIVTNENKQFGDRQRVKLNVKEDNK